MRDAFDKMVEFLPRLGVRESNDIPYDVQAVLLFALMYYAVEISPEEVERWFWASTFAEEHQGKPESYVTRLIRLMRAGEGRDALVVRRGVDEDLFANRVRRSGTAVATGFDLLLRVSGARSLLSGDSLSDREVLHGNIFDREAIEAARGARLTSGQLLANLVLLTPDDAREWRAVGIAEAYRLCAERTGEAEVIWASQALGPPDEETTPDVLYPRSRQLLARVT